MRDRRNTNLSTCSASSCDSTTTSSPTPCNEKDFPPLPSPSLPLPVVTKENCPKKSPYRSMAVKILAVLCTIVIIHRCLSVTSAIPLDLGQIASNPDLPTEPTVLPVNTQFGSQRWTPYIPHNSSFPLPTTSYNDICTAGQALSRSIKQSSRLHHVRDWSRGSSSYDDDTFLDPAEAERTGVLPQTTIINQDECKSSLTFVLGENDIGLGKTLLLLWMSYGLASRERRAFFIDDSNWAYGSYASYFTPVPTRDCVPPPRHHITPCPHNARHLLVSSSLAHWVFDAAFDEKYSKTRKHDSIYEMIRHGYEDLFRLSNTGDAAYLKSHVDEWRDNATTGAVRISLHIRRGDLHPYEYQFSRDYLPLEHYANAALSHLNSHGLYMQGRTKSFIVASDDPTLFSNPDLIDAVSPLTLSRPQERILLASKEALDLSQPVTIQRINNGAYSKYRDENSGWDGGFYPALFYSMGGSTAEQKMQIRSLIARAYLMDMAVLKESDAVVCAVSSASCRLLGVMMGEDRIRNKQWINVDDGREWSWDGRR